MNTNHKQHNAHRGQSLVDVALFFPIFIILLAGVVEVANILITQNRVTSAARAATRFGADGGQDEGMAVVVLNTVTQTLETDPAVWDIWSVRGTINANGDGFEPGTWEFNHIYGISNTIRFPDVNELEIQQQVLQELQTDEDGDSSQPTIAGGLRIVGTYATHDIDSILGLQALPQFANMNSATELAVMRLAGLNHEVTDGCTAFPIAVHEGIRSVTPQLYPAANDFDSPNPPTYGSFSAHTPDVPLLEAKEGDVYLIQNGFGAGNFGWLSWNKYINPSANTLQASLTWPGDSNDYTNHGDGGQVPPGFGYTVRGFINAIDDTDTTLSLGDWVAVNTGSVNANGIRSILNEHISLGRTLRVIVWDTAADPGVNGRYHISRFGIFKLHGYSLNQGGQPSWILAEFIRWDTSCGQ
ncbi:MAG TPA: pilus assembly protein [Chloroflexi bacterium]|nr:pilus assembly protein [Chloroflexota bacterium]